MIAVKTQTYMLPRGNGSKDHCESMVASMKHKQATTAI